MPPQTESLLKPDKDQDAHSQLVKPQVETPKTSVSNSSAASHASSVRKARAASALKSIADRAAEMTGGPAANSYDIKGKQKRESTDYQNWNVVGVGAGNREHDVANKEGKIKNAQHGAPKVGQADLSKVKFETDNEGNGVFHESGAGVAGWKDSRKDKFSYDAEKGGKVDIWGGSAAAGAREKLGARAKTEGHGDWGKADASADAAVLAEAGVSAGAKLNSDGFHMHGTASAKAGAEANASAAYKSPELKIDGVEKPITAGVEGSASAFGGVKAGVEGKAGISKEFIGVKGSAGAFAGVEASAEAKAHIGPVAAKAGVSGMAGAGIGADGSIVFEDGHLRVGGRLYAALGLGAAVETSVDIDLKQAVDIGIATAKEAYALADADKDGRITLNDPAAHAANAMTGAAKAVDSGVDATLHTLDANNDG